MIDLGTLGGEDSISYGYAINDKGQVAGSSDRADLQHHAFLYNGIPGAGGQMYDLGTITGQFSRALGINNHGDIVGYGTRPVTGQGAFLYTGTPGVDGHMIDLNAWLDANNPIDGANWLLVTATGINDSGFITGEGFYKIGTTSVTRAYLLDASALIPEPHSLGLLGLCAAALARRRRR
jgi:probable HAF family extracellular repeat protein